MNVKLTIDSITNLILGERQYQKLRWAKDDEAEAFHTSGNWIKFIDFYLHRATEAFSTNNGPDAALDQLRKVVTLAFAALESKGYTMERVLANTRLLPNADWNVGEYIIAMENEIVNAKMTVLR